MLFTNGRTYGSDTLSSLEALSPINGVTQLPRPKKQSNVETAAQVAGRHRRLKEPRASAVAIKTRGGSPDPRVATVPNNAKEALQAAFQGLGGVPALTAWAMKNPGEFYTKLWGRLVPRDVLLGADQGLEDLLTQLAEQRTTPGMIDCTYTEVDNADA